MTADQLEASETLFVHAEERLLETEVRERISCHDTRPIGNLLSYTLPPKVMALVRQVCTRQAVDAWDRLSANEYWGMTVLVNALLSAEIVPLTDDDIKGAARRLLDEALRDGATAALLDKINEHFDDLTPDELASAKAQGFVVTDETYPFEMEQDRINPIFCL